MSLLTFERSRSKLKLRVQGHNYRSENVPLAIARLWFKIFFTKFGSLTEIILAAQNML